MNTDKHGFNRRKQRERRGEKRQNHENEPRNHLAPKSTNRAQKVVAYMPIQTKPLMNTGQRSRNQKSQPRMNADKHGFNRRKQRERRGEKIIKRIANLKFEISKLKICAA